MHSGSHGAQQPSAGGLTSDVTNMLAVLEPLHHLFEFGVRWVALHLAPRSPRSCVSCVFGAKGPQSSRVVTGEGYK
jgi:hypothetical protein